MNPRGSLALMAVVTVVLWQFPWGQLALLPFTLIATYAHEMGHGVSALVLGGSFDALQMYPDGSGIAQWHGNVGPLGRAFIAGGGLVGPSLVGGLLLAATRVPRGARWLLLGIAIVMAASVLLVVRNPFGVLFVGGMAAVLALVVRFKPSWSVLTLRVVAVQLSLSIFRDIDYMFSSHAVVAGTPRPSDSQVMAEALLLPYWFWGALTAGLAIAFLLMGLWIAVRPTGRGRRPTATPEVAAA